MKEKLLPPSFQFNSANIGDFESMMVFESEIFGNDAWSEEGMLTELLENPDGFLVVRNQGEIIAYIASQIGYRNLISLKGPESDGLISSLAVASEYRRMGLGRELLQETIKKLALRGVQRIILHTRVDNIPMITLCQMLGFLDTGARIKQSADKIDSMEMILNAIQPERPFKVTNSCYSSLL